MSEKLNRSDEQPSLTNYVPDETGTHDARFILWRMFCAEHNIAVETLPSQLSGEAKEAWEAVKETHLRKPSEERT